MRRGDVVGVRVRYANGDVDTYGPEEVRVGSIIKDVTMDSKEGRDRMEWDSIEIHVSGPKRKVREAPDQ